jgi:crotonobetainyl-CoA:carnitine CoA-transferase CaiB-like acyl-CoA transferase
LAPEVTLGKRCARLDLHQALDRGVFERLLSQADILVHGYRADALARLGYGSQQRHSIRPGLVDVSLNAYGHSGPWVNRRGFDSLVQLSVGIAAQGQLYNRAEVPVSLPVQALDHATGYLMAAAAVRGLISRLMDNRSTQYRFSLARTARLLCAHQAPVNGKPVGPLTSDDVSTGIEHTAWGPAFRVRAPAEINGAAFHWQRPATTLGSDLPQWAE